MLVSVIIIYCNVLQNIQSMYILPHNVSFCIPRISLKKDFERKGLIWRVTFGVRIYSKTKIRSKFVYVCETETKTERKIVQIEFHFHMNDIYMCEH